MRLGMVGLGRMGKNMAERLVRHGITVDAFDPDPAARQAAEPLGIRTHERLEALVEALQPPRFVWLMVPDRAVDETFHHLLQHLAPGDTVVDGGNSNYRLSQARHRLAAEAGVAFLDVGVSGGIWGRTEGYCLMIGGDEASVRSLEPVFRALAPADGWCHVGPPGAGHFVKMVHNGIEYGLLQAYGEGFALLSRKTAFRLDLAAIARLWLHGSVIRSWLLELLAGQLTSDPSLAQIRGIVADSGEGRWTVEEAVELGVPLPAISAALFARFATQEEDPFAAKVVAALRNAFGGHAVVRAELPADSLGPDGARPPAP